jgi:hypothetical protein
MEDSGFELAEGEFWKSKKHHPKSIAYRWGWPIGIVVPLDPPFPMGKWAVLNGLGFPVA